MVMAKGMICSSKHWWTSAIEQEIAKLTLLPFLQEVSVELFLQQHVSTATGRSGFVMSLQM